MVMLAIVIGSGCGVKTTPPPSTSSRTPFNAAAWAYPGATEVVSIGGAEVTANDTRGGPPRLVDRTPIFQVATTPDPFESVFGFYAERLGASKEYLPGKTANSNTTPVSLTDTRAGVDPMIAGSIIHAGRPLRDRVKTATLVKHDPGGDILIILSRGEGEDLTTIELIAIERPGK